MRASVRLADRLDVALTTLLLPTYRSASMSQDLGMDQVISPTRVSGRGVATLVVYSAVGAAWFTVAATSRANSVTASQSVYS